MKCIADVNVLLPLLCGGHIAEKAAYDWFENQGSGTIGWCLPVRLAILRHLSNPHIMGVPLEPERALDVWGELENDERLFELGTLPPETERFLRQNVAGRQASPKLWTDAWLAAVAEATGVRLVSFDKGFERFQLTSLELLSP